MDTHASKRTRVIEDLPSHEDPAYVSPSLDNLCDDVIRHIIFYLKGPALACASKRYYELFWATGRVSVTESIGFTMLQSFLSTCMETEIQLPADASELVAHHKRALEFVLLRAVHITVTENSIGYVGPILERSTPAQRPHLASLSFKDLHLIERAGKMRAWLKNSTTPLYFIERVDLGEYFLFQDNGQIMTIGAFFMDGKGLTVAVLRKFPSVSDFGGTVVPCILFQEFGLTRPLKVQAVAIFGYPRETVIKAAIRTFSLKTIHIVPDPFYDSHASVLEWLRDSVHQYTQDWVVHFSSCDSHMAAYEPTLATDRLGDVGLQGEQSSASLKRITLQLVYECCPACDLAKCGLSLGPADRNNGTKFSDAFNISVRFKIRTHPNIHAHGRTTHFPGLVFIQ